MGFLARSVLLASREESALGPWDALGLPPAKLLRLLARMCGEPMSPLFHARFSIVKVAGHSVAAAAGLELDAPPNDWGRLPMTWASEVGRWLVVDPKTLRRLLPTGTGGWNLAWLATLPEHRRVGHANTLIEEILGDGRWRGYAQASTELSSRNTAAIRALCEVGFEIVGEEEGRSRLSISL